MLMYVAEHPEISSQCNELKNPSLKDKYTLTHYMSRIHSSHSKNNIFLWLNNAFGMIFI